MGHRDRHTEWRDVEAHLRKNNNRPVLTSLNVYAFILNSVCEQGHPRYPWVVDITSVFHCDMEQETH